MAVKEGRASNRRLIGIERRRRRRRRRRRPPRRPPSNQRIVDPDGVLPTTIAHDGKRNTSLSFVVSFYLFIFFVIDKKRERKAPTVPKLGRTSNQKQGAVDCRSRPPRNPNFDCGENKKLGQTRSLSLSLYL